MTASASGSQLPGYAGGAARAIWVVGAQKVVPDLSAALRRVEEHALPLENARALEAYGMPSAVNRLLVLNAEPQPGARHRAAPARGHRLLTPRPPVRPRSRPRKETGLRLLVTSPAGPVASGAWSHQWRIQMAELPPPPEGIVLAHFIVSDDVERSRRFYTEVLGGRVVFSGDVTYVALANTWIIINVGGGPTDDKPSVTLETPRDPDRVSSFLNIRVKDIHAVYAEWSARGAQFLTPPKQHQYEIRCYIRDPDGHLIEVGQTTDPGGDWVPAHWPPGTRQAIPSECRGQHEPPAPVLRPSGRCRASRAA